MEKTKLDCIYYPFSRLLDPTTLKHLLLVFDSITFLDEADSPQWRRALLDQMRQDSSLFGKFEELADDYDLLEDAGIVQIRNPQELTASRSMTVAIATVSDLQDPHFVDLAASPHRFDLPARQWPFSHPARPTWQAFEGKLAEPLRIDPAFTSNPTWTPHVLCEGNQSQSWSLTYEAGCSSVLNYYLEAADEMALTPVTSSNLHHKLVLRKLKRIADFAADQSSLDSDIRIRCQAILGQGEILRLFNNLFPPQSLASTSFAEIIRFRNETTQQRQQFLAKINNTLRVIDADVSSATYGREVALAVLAMENQLSKVQDDISKARDRLLPAVGDAVLYGAAGSGALGALATFLGGVSPAGLVAASALAVSGALLSQTSKAWATRRGLLRSQDSSVSYLLSISRLKGSKK